MKKELNKNSNRTYLINIGMKKALVDKLSDKNIQGLLSFSMEHSKASNLLNMVIQLASMELKNKEGSIFLASEGLATPAQLKDLSPEQVVQALDDFHFHEDPKLTIKYIRQMVIVNQQEKLYHHSGGIKGEFYMDQKDVDEDHA